MEGNGFQWTHPSVLGLLISFEKAEPVLRLRGNSPATVDEKGRLKLPSTFKADLESFAQSEGGGELRFYLTSLDRISARLFPMPVWEGIEARLAAIPSTTPAKRRFLEVTAYYGSEVAPDAQGRFVIPPVGGLEHLHAEAVGVELDQDLCKLSAAKILKLGLDKHAHIVNGDLLKQDYSSADLVTVYLLGDAGNNLVQPLLDKQLKKGARVVAKDFDFRNWTPEKVENIADDGEGRSHTLYLYRK